MQKTKILEEPLRFQEQTLLDSIDHLARWLPTREAHREELILSVGEVDRHLPTEPVSRAELYRLQMHTWALEAGPLKSLLVRRVGELGRLVISENVATTPKPSDLGPMAA